MPELSQRAQSYLNTLERRSSVPTETVKQALIDNGYPANEKWLDFHERYAGYCQSFGHDGATWGLVHADTRYSLIDGRPLSVEAYKDESDGLWHAAAADCHPSYDFTIDERGHCPELCVSSFNVHLEQSAIYREFMTQGEKPKQLWSHDEITQIMTQTTDAIPQKLASDEYRQWWLGEKILAELDVESDRWLRVFRR